MYLRSNIRELFYSKWIQLQPPELTVDVTYNTYVHSVMMYGCDSCGFTTDKPTDFCPSCGRAMTDKARKLLSKRIEDLRFDSEE